MCLSAHVRLVPVNSTTGHLLRFTTSFSSDVFTSFPAQIRNKKTVVFHSI